MITFTEIGMVRVTAYVHDDLKLPLVRFETLERHPKRAAEGKTWKQPKQNACFPKVLHHGEAFHPLPCGGGDTDPLT